MQQVAPIDTGGPAYPGRPADIFSIDKQGKMQPEYSSGLTIRDHFAGLAMQAILQSQGNWGKKTADDLHYGDDYDGVMSQALCLAEGAYQMADAMIKKRKS